MTMTTDLLAKMGRKPLYAALEDWLDQHIQELDDVIGEPKSADMRDFQNIIHAIDNIAQHETAEQMEQRSQRPETD